MSRDPEWELDGFDLVPRDHLNLIDVDFELKDQLDIIRAILHRHRLQADSTLKEIKTIEAATKRLQGRAAEHAVEDWGTMIHWAAYEDAAHAMLATALIAPLYERVLRQCLARIGEHFHLLALPNPSHPRWKGTAVNWWDCRYAWQESKWVGGIYDGANQLLEALGLLPTNFPRIYAVIVAYRNKTFHFGLEWPLPERRAFVDRIRKEAWPPDWFNYSESGKDPWMVALTDKFVDQSIKLLLELTDLLGGYVQKHKTAV